MSDKVSASSCLFLLIFVPLGLGIHFALDGWALSTLWGWFLVEQFPHYQIPVLSIPQAIGISMLLAFAVRPSPDLKKDTKSSEKAFGALMAWFLMAPPIVVFTGWILKTHFM